ncbi:MAG: transglutaminase domain-containing protein [Candidatus Korarchaeota archaeon]|nr:transglutaminase domain-containing protein [Candidatus Korarchaeota archaeon]
MRIRRFHGLKYYYTKSFDSIINSNRKISYTEFIGLPEEIFYVEEGNIEELEIRTEVLLLNPSQKRVRDISIDFYIPSEDLHQKIRITKKSHGDLKIRKDSYGNLIASLKLDVIPPKKKEKVFVSQVANLNAVKINDIEWGFPEKTHDLQINYRGRLQNPRHEDIIAIANKIKSKDLYTTVTNCIKFIKANVKYERNAYRLGGRFALKHQKGACDEISDLCASILMALNIPIRTVLGYVIPENFHAWLEIFSSKKGWIPVDPTFGFMGFIGARWLKIFVEPKPNTKLLKIKCKGTIVPKLTFYLEDMKIN